MRILHHLASVLLAVAVAAAPAVSAGAAPGLDRPAAGRIDGGPAHASGSLALRGARRSSIGHEARHQPASAIVPGAIASAAPPSDGREPLAANASLPRSRGRHGASGRAPPPLFFA